MDGLEEVDVICPYCGEAISVFIDASSGTQEYYEDCSVCCAPILFLLSVDEAGEISLTLKRDNE